MIEVACNEVGKERCELGAACHQWLLGNDLKMGNWNWQGKGEAGRRK